MVRRIQKLAFPTVAMLWVTYYFIETMSKPESARILIGPLYLLLLVLFALICHADFREYRKMAARPETPVMIDTRAGKAVWLCLVASAIYVAVMPYLGFLLSTTAFLAIGFTSLGAKNRALSFIVAVVFTVALYYFFHTLLYVALPSGIFWRP